MPSKNIWQKPLTFVRKLENNKKLNSMDYRRGSLSDFHHKVKRIWT